MVFKKVTVKRTKKGKKVNKKRRSTKPKKGKGSLKNLIKNVIYNKRKASLPDNWKRI